jgi:molybdopterin synthase catalytic subunit
VIDGKKVESIEYTTYEEMALEKMNTIREEMFEKFELTCLHVYHSLGIVKTGEICLLFLLRHRTAKMRSKPVSELVERIKARITGMGKRNHGSG